MSQSQENLWTDGRTDGQTLFYRNIPAFRGPINNVDLEEKVCKELSLTDTKVKPDDLDACHRMKKKDKMIIKFKNRNQRNMIFKQKELNSKGDDPLALQFG